MGGSPTTGQPLQQVPEDRRGRVEEELHAALPQGNKGEEVG